MPPLEPGAPMAPCDDPPDLSVDEATALLARLVEPITETEDLDLGSALGRVLAHDLVSPIHVPPHDNAAMDGYAFDGAQLQPGQPLRLRVAGAALAGQVWTAPVAAGDSVKIMTGAKMPAGLDTVVPLELVQADGEAHIVLPANAVRAGDNRRRLGEDLAAGQPALHHGLILGPAALGLIASLGLPTVTVRRRLRVALFSTGDEILSLGEAPREGAVYDSNRYTLHGLLTRLGVEVIDLGVVRDTPTDLEDVLRRAAREADAVVTSGGMSMGDADHTRSLLRQMGEVAFWRIAMRPGRPMAAGRIAPAPGSPPALLFGLPGNPVAAMVTFLVFVRPALLRAMGAQVAPPVLLRAICAETVRKKSGRTEYQRGIVVREADGTLHVRTTGAQGSGVLRSMVEANGLIVLHHGQGQVGAGEPVDVWMFDGAI